MLRRPGACEIRSPRALDVGQPHRDVVAGEEIPHERRTMPEIGERMAHDRLRPGFGDCRRTEQSLLAFDLAHHEIAGLQPPIDVPLGRSIAGVQQQRALRLAPGDWKLVLPGEVADAAEVEYHDRLQRMLSRRAERAVIHDLHQREKSHHRRDEQDRRALPGHLCRPGNVSAKDGCAVKAHWTQQATTGMKRNTFTRQKVPRHLLRQRTIGGRQPGRNNAIFPDDSAERRPALPATAARARTGGSGGLPRESQQKPPVRVAIRRNMLPDGAIGSIAPHSTVMTGDCQSPSTPLAMSS
jgi:hypothetical protein